MNIQILRKERIRSERHLNWAAAGTQSAAISTQETASRVTLFVILMQ